jgi:predicted nucleic acid-binding protein
MCSLTSYTSSHKRLLGSRSSRKGPLCRAIVKMELIAGCRNAREQHQAEKLLAKFPTVYTTIADQERALAHFRDVHLKNAIGLPDLLIAETAKGLGAMLCTLNEKHFKAVPGLTLEVPYRRGTFST